MKNILTQIEKEVFTAKEALKEGLSYYELNLYVKEGLLIKVDRGVFAKATTTQVSSDNEHYAVVLAKLGNPSALCLWSALVFHDLTEEAPAEIWVYVPYKKTCRLDIRTVRKRNPQWDVGIETIDGVRVTTIERTLVDVLLDRRHFSEVQAYKILMDAIRAKRTTFNKLYTMAKKLKVEGRLKRDFILLEETYV
jgi:predicted transcriptional regulator of viral defense system